LKYKVCFILKKAGDVLGKFKSIPLNTYFYEINFIRSVAALSVVMVHVTATNYSVNDGHLNWLLLFLNQIVRYGTPFFAVISGFLLYNQTINRKFALKRFILSRFTKVLLPFIIWSFIYLIIKSDYILDIFTIENTKLFVYNFVLGKSHYHLYFIAVVLQFYLLFIFIHRFNNKKILFLLTLLSFFLTYFNFMLPYPVESGILSKFMSERSFILNWLFYFFFGGLLVHFWQPIVEYVQKNVKYILLVGLVPLIFLVYEYKTREVVLNSTRVTNLFYVPVLFIALISVYFMVRKYKVVHTFLLTVGNMSMGIYLIHPLVIYYLKEHLTWLFEGTSLTLITYAFTVLISMLVVKIIHMLPFGQYVVIIASRNKKRKLKVEKI